MITITLNSLNINSGNYSVNTIQHDSGTPLELNTLVLAREDGEKLISTRYSAKKFTIEGLIKGDTQQELEYRLDTFKKTVSGSALNLDIDYGYGRTRRYVVAVSNIAITREFFNLTFAPYSLELSVLDPPFGQETTEEEVFSGNAFTLPTETFSCVFSGTAEPKPEIEMTMDTVGGLGNIALKNQTTDTQMDIYTAWANSDILQIDTALKKVQLNSQDIEFEGIFPECELGLNNLLVQFDAATSLNQTQTEWTNPSNSYASKWNAQSFLGTAETYNRLDLILYAGDYWDDPVIRIETDNGGKPSGTLVHANATATLSSSDIPSTPNWVSINFNPFNLTAATYWIVVKSPGTTSLRPLLWELKNSSVYADGVAAYTLNSGSTWTSTSYDFTFKLYRQVTPNWSIDTKVKYTRRYL